MKGDILASGGTSATWSMSPDKPARSKRTAVTLKEKRKLFCECKDCGFKAYSVSEFSQHVSECPADNKPAKNVAEVKARSGKKNMRVPA